MVTVELRQSAAINPDENTRTAGPFEWVQLTYNELRVSPEGDSLAVYDTEGDVWISEDETRWSDVVIA